MTLDDLIKMLNGGNDLPSPGNVAPSPAFRAVVEEGADPDADVKQDDAERFGGARRKLGSAIKSTASEAAKAEQARMDRLKKLHAQMVQQMSQQQARPQTSSLFGTNGLFGTRRGLF